MAYYKDPDRSKIALLAALYDCQQMISELAARVVELETNSHPQKKPVWVTRHWSKPKQAVDGDWVLPKPSTLECSATGVVGDCEVVESVELPDAE